MSAATINPTGFNIVDVGCPPPNTEGDRTFLVTLDFSVSTDITVDFSGLQQKAQVFTVQAFYIDNLSNIDPVTIVIPSTGQHITVPFGAQGYMPVLSQNPPVFNINCANTAAKIKMHFLNFYMPPYFWGIGIGSNA